MHCAIPLNLLASLCCPLVCYPALLRSDDLQVLRDKTTDLEIKVDRVSGN